MKENDKTIKHPATARLKRIEDAEWKRRCRVGREDHYDCDGNMTQAGF